MTFTNEVLTYLGFCPTKESAQRFRVRNNTLTLKQKEYRKAIIRGIGSGLVGATLILYLNQGKYPWDPWRVIITYSIFFAMARLIGGLLRKRREEKNDQRRERESHEAARARY